MLFIFNTINLIKDIGILENFVRPGEKEEVRFSSCLIS